MASSAAHRVAGRAPPPPAQLAAFYKLVDKQAIAGVLSRAARHAELSAQAAVLAQALFGDDSLVVSSLRIGESESLAGLATAASGAEQDVLARQSWDVLVSLIPPLLRRLEANTLLPGTVKEEELEYSAYMQAAILKAKNMPIPPTTTRPSTLGYITLLFAMYRSLDLVHLPLWSQRERKNVESFVLLGLDVIPRTAGIPAYLITGEDRVVFMIERYMSLRNYDPVFCAAVLRKWHSDAVSSVLRARGILQTGIVAAEQIKAEFDARQRSDTAKHGLRDCALPSYAKTEKTVKEFAGCSGCRSVVYCCLEHQALDWKAHKKVCREKEAARRAAEEAEQRAEVGGDGGAGAE